MPTFLKRPTHAAAVLAAITILAAGWSAPVRAQVRFSGQAYAMAYATEDPAADGGRVDAYQGIRFRFRPETDFDFRGHVRFARMGDTGDWSTRIYQAYADARLSGSELTLRMGRQFVYSGVINGTLDAASVHYRPVDGLDVQAVVGMAAPYTRDAELATWDDGGVFGAQVAHTMGRDAKISASYFRRNRNSQAVWHLLGGAASFRLAEALYLQSNLDYNLESDRVQRMRHRLWYESGRWIVSGEFATQRPQIYEDSFFNIFDLTAYRQGRAGVSMGLLGLRLGYDLIYTQFDKDDSREHLVSLGSRWGTIGFVYQDGYAGDRIGLYADANVDVTSWMAIRLHTSRLEYERRSTALTEDATAFSGGLVLRPVRRVTLHVEGQRSYNTYFEHDTRFYARASYAL